MSLSYLPSPFSRETVYHKRNTMTTLARQAAVADSQTWYRSEDGSILVHVSRRRGQPPTAGSIVGHILDASLFIGSFVEL